MALTVLRAPPRNPSSKGFAMTASTKPRPRTFSQRLLPLFILHFSFFTFHLPASAVDTLHVASPDPLLEPWRWTTFDRSSGLAGRVRNIFEDRDGAIWFATDRGVQRYDGINWTTYTTEDSLAHNQVRAITQTRDGAMWFGTFGGGISRFDGQTWTTYTSEDGLASNHIWWRGLLQTRDGAIWAGFQSPQDTTGTASGISRFDGQTWTTIDVPEGSPRPGIRDIHEAADGSLWFTTNNQGVLRFNGADWMRYTTEDGLAGNDGVEILESRDRALWFACTRDGISRFDGKQWRTYTARDGLPEGPLFLSLWQTADGTIWASGGGNAGGTLCRFDGEQWKTYTSEEVSQLSGYVFAQPARDGVIWFWGWGQPRVFRFDPTPTRWTVYPDIQANGIYSIGDEMWFGMDEGAVRYDRRTWVRYTAADGLIDGPVETVLRGKDGSLWVAGRHRDKSGAARFDGTRWRVFSETDGLVGNNIFTGFVADNGDIWFGTQWGTRQEDQSSGAMRFDGTEWTVYTTENGLAHNRVYDIAQTPDGAIWFALSNGLSRFDGEHWTQFDPGDQERPNQRPSRLCVTDDGRLWVAHGNNSRGVVRYDGKTWQRFTTEDGLGGDSVWKIYQSRDGTLWFGTDAGLTRFNGETWQTYSRDDIPISFGYYISNRIAESPDGALWLEGASGLVRFMPDQTAPETALEPGADRISSAGNILMRWSGRDLWDDTPPDKIRYQWRMDGGPWSRASDLTDFTFTSLSDGGHEFEVRALDRDGNPDPTPAVHAFVVEPPWWKNPYVLGLGLVLLGLVGVQTSRVVRRERRLQGSNAALSQANKELFTVNQELQQKTEDLEEANRELQRERSIERVRGQVQSMKRASDFESVLSLLTEDLKTVGLHFDTCSIDVLVEPVEDLTMASLEEHGLRYTTYKLDPEGIVTQESYHLAAPFPDMMRAPIQRFVAGKVWQGRDVDLGAMVEIPIAHYGRLRMTAPDREAFNEEDIDALQDFASAIALGYVRYLDFEQLEKQNKQIQEQTERKSRFLASMSHELRTPMNAIIGFTRLVLRRGKSELSDRNQENLHKVRGSADHLLALINDILDLSKIEAGRMEVNPEPFEVKDLIASCCGAVSPLVKSGVRLTYDISDGIGEANTDQGRLRQIVINLLSNALKFTDFGEVAVRVSQNGQPNPALEIAVSDTGIGIPSDALDTIFEEFRQVDGANKKQKGTGLGLSITRGWTELLGGTIEVESEVGKGSVFTVRVPVVYKGVEKG